MLSGQSSFSLVKSLDQVSMIYKNPDTELFLVRKIIERTHIFLLLFHLFLARQKREFLVRLPGISLVL